MKNISLRLFPIIKYIQFFFVVAILAISNSAQADLTVSVEPNNRGFLSFLSDCNIVLSFGSDTVIDVSKLLIKLNGDDVTKEITTMGAVDLSEDKRSLKILYPAKASDFHQGEYTFEVSTAGAAEKAALDIQEYRGKAICVNCDSASRSIADADLDKIVEDETRGGAKKKEKVNGDCGSSDGKSFDTAPKKNLCDKGDATDVTGSGPFKWNCKGKNGGKNAVCSAKCSAKKTITKPTQQSPDNNAELKTASVNFSWTHPYNDNYELIIKTSSGNIVYKSGIIKKSKSQTVDLSKYLTNGNSYKWYVVVYANDLVTSSEDRWFTYKINTITKPTQQSPDNGAEIKTAAVNFSWTHPSNSKNDQYELIIKTSSGTTIHSKRDSSKSQTVDLSKIPLTNGSTYKWYVVVYANGLETSSANRLFVYKTNTITKPMQLSPDNNTELKTASVNFSWTHPYNDRYELKIKTDSGTKKYESGKISSKSKTIDLSKIPLTNGSTYKWYVVVYTNGLETSSADRSFVYRTNPITQPQLLQNIEIWKKQLQDAKFEDVTKLANSIASTWAIITNKVTGAQLKEKYKSLYAEAQGQLIKARNLIDQSRTHYDRRELTQAKDDLDEAIKCYKSASSKYQMACDVWVGLLDAGTILAKGLQDASDTALKGLATLVPGASSVVTAITSARNFVQDYCIEGPDMASQKLAVNIAISIVFTEFSAGKVINGSGAIDLKTLAKRLTEDSVFRNRVEILIVKGLAKHYSEDVAKNITVKFMNQFPKSIS